MSLKRYQIERQGHDVSPRLYDGSPPSLMTRRANCYSNYYYEWNKIICFMVLFTELCFLSNDCSITAWNTPSRLFNNYQRHYDMISRPYYSDCRNKNLNKPFFVSSKSGDSDYSDDEDLDFPELSSSDGTSMTAVPTTDNDLYVTETEVADQVNDMLLRSGNDDQSIELQTELSNSFLQYALSIILGRAIPDARDGLKPVHRRILYAMYDLQLTSSSTYRKCARVVGDVLGKYHPHGDTAVYDALVRMAQDFSTNHPLIDGHGNFGSIDNDPAAAMRYTECRLTPLSQIAMLSDLSDDSVDQISTFDGSSFEPVVLPARVPVLLLNGAAGIAVGMATNIPPHNLRELMTASIALAKSRIFKQIITTDQLLEMVPAPDFPTGAMIMGTSGAKDLYTTGNGGIVLRAVTNFEPITTSGNKLSSRMAIIVTELPYQVNKAAMLEKIAELVNDKKLEGIADLRDESSGREGIRIVIELKRDAVADVVLANLYQKTALQTTFAGNFLALMKSSSTSNNVDDDESNAKASNLIPQRFTLRHALDCFLDFRFETIRRKARYQLRKVENRAHIVDGLLMALEKLDEVIGVVRAAPDTQTARMQLQRVVLGTSDEQTDAILRLQLGQLTRLNKGKLEQEQSDLTKSQEQLTQLLTVDDTVYQSMVDDFQELSNKFGVNRKTKIYTADDGTVEEIDMIRNSRSVVVVTRGGYIKRMPLKTFESQGRGTRGKRGSAVASSSTAHSKSAFDDEIAHCFTCNDHDTVLMVTGAGVAYGIRAYHIPTSGRTARGQPFPQVLPQLKMGDIITTILPISDFTEPNEFLLLVSEHGWIKKTPLIAFEKLPIRGLIVASLDDDDRLLWCQRCTDKYDVLVGTRGGMATRFSVAKLRPTGRTSRGVRTMKLRNNDKISDVNVVPAGGGDDDDDDDGDDCEDDRADSANNAISENDAPTEYVLAVSSLGYGKRIPTAEFRTQARGGVGVVALKFKKKNTITDNESDIMTCLRAVKENDEIMVVTTKGIMVRQQVSKIPSQGRAATGVLIQKLDDGDHISSVSIVPEYDDSD
jgi:DNA gyrase subunit A